MSSSELERISVVGTSGAGKTSLARSLSGRLQTPCVELDALHWGPNWTPRTDFTAAVERTVAEPRWVIDGNYSAVRELIWRRATAIVWLDYSFARVFSRALVRTAGRLVTRERLWADNRESLRMALTDREGVLWWIIRSYRRRRRQYREFFASGEYAHARLVTLQTPEDAERLLLALTSPTA